MKEDLQQLIAKVLPLFMRYGIKSLTMDDIARELKISKKTLYEYVKDKQDLVLKTVQFHIEGEKNCTCQITESHQNAIDELLAISVHVTKELKQIHPSIHYDLSKYYPQAWEEFNKYRTEHLYQCICDNIQAGIEEGLFRKEVNIPMIAKFYIHRIDLVFNPEVFPFDQFNPDQVYLEMLKYHIHGISTPKGAEYLRQTLETPKP